MIFRDPQGGSSDEAESSKKFEKDDICPWDSPVAGSSYEEKKKKLGISSCTGSMASEEVWESDPNSCLNSFDPRISRKNSSQLDSGSSSSEISQAIVEVSERLRRSCGITQQSSLPGNEDIKSRKLSTGDKNDSSRRSSIAAPRNYSDGGSKTSPDRNVSGIDKKTKIVESARPSVSSTEDVSVIPPITATTSLPQQVTVVPQQPPKADNSSDKLKDNKLDSDISKTNKKSQSGVRKRSSLSMAPLISVSSVVEDAGEDEVSTSNRSKEEEEAGNKPQSLDKGDEYETSTEAALPGTSEIKPNDPAVCPWEDE